MQPLFFLDTPLRPSRSTRHAAFPTWDASCQSDHARGARFTTALRACFDQQGARHRPRFSACAACKHTSSRRPDPKPAKAWRHPRRPPSLAFAVRRARFASAALARFLRGRPFALLLRHDAGATGHHTGPTASSTLSATFVSVTLRPLVASGRIGLHRALCRSHLFSFCRTSPFGVGSDPHCAATFRRDLARRSSRGIHFDRAGLRRWIDRHGCRLTRRVHFNRARLLGCVYFHGATLLSLGKRSGAQSKTSWQPAGYGSSLFMLQSTTR